MSDSSLYWLRLAQLSDSALPIGALAHSFGLETLVAEGALTVPNLGVFLHDYLSETGKLESFFCRKAYQVAEQEDTFAQEWLAINRQLDALKLARESREASTALGRRFLQLALKLETHTKLESAVQIAKERHVGTHYCAAFGLVCGVLTIPLDMALNSFLHQSVISLVSVFQRLLPLGQTQASQLIWALKPAILETAAESAQASNCGINHFYELPFVFTPAVEVGSMRHPDLRTRLFIS